MRFRCKIELRRCAPTAYFDVLLSALTDRYTGMGQVWNTGENVTKPAVVFLSSFLQLLNLFAHLLGFSNQRRSVFAGLFQLRNLLRRLVALRLHGLRRSDGLSPLCVYLTEIFQ